MTYSRNLFSVLLSTLALISLASAQEPRTEAPEEQHPALQTLKACPSHTVKVASQQDWRKYAVIRLLPAEYQPSNLNHRLSPTEAQRMTTALDTALVKVFRNTAQQSGPILDVRPVITDVKRSSPVVNLLSFAAINTAVSYGRASVRFELVDDQSGAVVGEVVNRGSARPWNIYPWQILSGFRPLGHSYIMLNRGAKALRNDMRTLQTKMPPQADPNRSSLGD